MESSDNIEEEELQPIHLPSSAVNSHPDVSKIEEESEDDTDVIEEANQT